jgi:hypothetical protein
MSEDAYILALIILAVPVTMVVYYAFAFVFRFLFFRNQVDLSDVMFNKEKIEQVERSDMEQERNIVAVREAVAVGDYHNQRELMMNIIRKDMKKSLGSITYALNSEDSETSHYAAAALRDELGEFRTTTHNLYLKIKESKGLDEETCHELVNLIHDTLVQDVFRESEQKSYVWMMDEVLNKMFQIKPSAVKDCYYEWITGFLIQVGSPDEALKWCSRARDMNRGKLVGYKCYLRYYYGIGDGENFTRTISELKRTDIKIDQDTLEILRLFNG